MSTKLKNYYSVLGVSRSATGEDIKKAFKKLAKTYHPDINHAPDAHQRFIEIGEAYEVLKDPSARANYDRLLGYGTSSAHNSSYNQQRRNDHNSYYSSQQRAKTQAKKYADMSLDDLLGKVIEFAFTAADTTYETGRAILVGEREKPRINIFDYLKMGLLGILLTICIILSFTGVGTIPGIAFGFIIIKGIMKKDSFIGIIPFILTTIVADILVIIFLLVLISNM
ncbi:DnaJ domain-containing protein [Bacillus sp. B15-48]|nr:DnaJ domain-containing protein [Bacillus sp. B15-48]